MTRIYIYIYIYIYIHIYKHVYSLQLETCRMPRQKVGFCRRDTCPVFTYQGLFLLLLRHLRMRQNHSSERCFSFLLSISTSYRFPILNSFLNHHPQSTLNASFFMQEGGFSIIKKVSYFCYEYHLLIPSKKGSRLIPRK